MANSKCEWAEWTHVPHLIVVILQPSETFSKSLGRYDLRIPHPDVTYEDCNGNPKIPN